MRIKVKGVFHEGTWIVVVRDHDSFVSAPDRFGLVVKELARYEYPAQEMHRRERNKLKLSLRKAWEMNMGSAL